MLLEGTAGARESGKNAIRPVAFGEGKQYNDNGFQRAATRSRLAKCTNERAEKKGVRENGNCGQWHGRAETYITRNHLGGVILGVTPTTQERVACNATLCKHVNKPKDVFSRSQQRQQRATRKA